jgi:hypothetical protein
VLENHAITPFCGAQDSSGRLGLAALLLMDCQHLGLLHGDSRQSEDRQYGRFRGHKDTASHPEGSSFSLESVAGTNLGKDLVL